MENNFYTEKYINVAEALNDFELNEVRTVHCESPSNIALIKYWGKYGDQLPQNPSLSFTLQDSKTETKLLYQKADQNNTKLEYYFDGQRNKAFELRVLRYLDKVSKYLPFIKKLDFKIDSKNSFPHSAGIASSASAFSALAMDLCSIENDLFGTLQNPKDFDRKASFLARLGSGSACRSIGGSAVLWGKTDLMQDSSNELAVPINEQIHHVFKTYHDAILIVSSESKVLSSSAGHALMQNHPFAKARYHHANINLEKLLLALKSGGEKLFSEIVEDEAMSLHALLLSSNPSTIMMKPNTLLLISKLKKFREQENLDFTFTLDAGPNIHVLYPQKIRQKIVAFIEKELKKNCENERWIDDKISMRSEPKMF